MRWGKIDDWRGKRQTWCNTKRTTAAGVSFFDFWWLPLKRDRHVWVYWNIFSTNEKRENCGEGPRIHVPWVFWLVDRLILVMMTHILIIESIVFQMGLKTHLYLCGRYGCKLYTTITTHPTVCPVRWKANWVWGIRRRGNVAIATNTSKNINDPSPPKMTPRFFPQFHPNQGRTVRTQKMFYIYKNNQ